MSTILYGDEKFLKIYQTMRNKRAGQEYAHLFKYPAGWNNPEGMDKHYQDFVDDLRLANIKAYNERYDDGNKLEFSLLDFTQTVLPYPSDIHFLKSLRGLRYNLDNADSNGCAKLLDYLIDEVSGDIIARMPAWETADTW